MFRRRVGRKGFGLLELVLCIGLLMMTLPMLWMIISFITDSMMRMALSIERDRTTYLIVMTIDRCISTSRSIELMPDSVFISSPLATCRLDIGPQRLRLVINDKERIFSEYQTKLRIRSVVDDGTPIHVTLILSDGDKDIYTYGFFTYVTPQM